VSQRCVLCGAVVLLIGEVLDGVVRASVMDLVDKLARWRADKADTNLMVASELALSAVCRQLVAHGSNLDAMVSTVRSSMVGSDKWRLRCNSHPMAHREPFDVFAQSA
jgi:hypothetical protein